MYIEVIDKKAAKGLIVDCRPAKSTFDLKQMISWSRLTKKEIVPLSLFRNERNVIKRTDSAFEIEETQEKILYDMYFKHKRSKSNIVEYAIN